MAVYHGRNNSVSPRRVAASPSPRDSAVPLLLFFSCPHSHCASSASLESHAHRHSSHSVASWGRGRATRKGGGGTTTMAWTAADPLRTALCRRPARPSPSGEPRPSLPCPLSLREVGCSRSPLSRRRPQIPTVPMPVPQDFSLGGGGGQLNLPQHWASHHALVPTPIICAPPPALCWMPKPFCPELGEALRGNYGGN